MYGFEPYHVLLAAVGVSIILAFWVPRFFSGREPATSALLILSGMCAFALVPGMPAEVFVSTQERTAVSYLVKPFTDQMSRAFRER